jgi:hypothetical protein
MDIAWRQSRYDKEGPGGDAAAYINCPMNKAEYEAFIDALLDGPKAEFKEWEHVPYFDGCLPIEVMAERGRETLRHGPMKPVGLTNPRDPLVKAYAIVQLRQDNALGTLWNMVGFQTKLKHGAQAETFRMIPGLENAQFARLGGLHRNTFINSPAPAGPPAAHEGRMPRLRFAGQITGVEGYVESAATGLLAGRFAAAERLGKTLDAPPPTTALGALVDHITGGHIEGGRRQGLFQPMNINYGLLPPLEAPKVDEDGVKIPLKERGRAKKRLMSLRALDSPNRTRGFDFNTFASELFSSLKVQKTASAETDEGSLGATVDLVTGRPFDYRGAATPCRCRTPITRTARPTIRASPPWYSDRWASTTWGQFGALFSIAYNKRNQTIDSYGVRPASRTTPIAARPSPARRTSQPAPRS